MASSFADVLGAMGRLSLVFCLGKVDLDWFVRDTDGPNAPEANGVAHLNGAGIDGTVVHAVGTVALQSKGGTIARRGLLGRVRLRQVAVCGWGNDISSGNNRSGVRTGDRLTNTLAIVGIYGTHFVVSTGPRAAVRILSACFLSLNGCL